MRHLVLPHDELGRGPAVVLLHAGVADRRMWSDVLPAVAGAGYRAIAIDLPGFGEAAVAADSAPHSSVVETLDALGVVRSAFIGVSFGGAVALRVAAVAPPRIGRLMLVSTPAPGVEPSAELLAVWDAEEAALQRGDIDAAVRAVVDAWTLPGAPVGLRDRVARMQRRAFELQAVGDGLDAVDDPLEHNPTVLETLDIPTLVAHGEFDMQDFVLGAQQLSRQLRGGPVVVIPGAGHLAPLERPQAFSDLLLKFLRETSASADRR
jgi:pimeloyl-ACP methyl ester carboxylesterase